MYCFYNHPVLKALPFYLTETFAEAKRRKERELYNGLSPYKIRRLNSKCYREKQHEYVLLLRRQSEKDQQRRAVYENGKTILKRLQRHASRTTSISPQSQSKCPLYTCPKKLRHLKKKRQVNRKFRKHESKEFSKCYPGYQSSVDDDDNIANVSFISNQTGRSRSPFPISSGSESSA